MKKVLVLVSLVFLLTGCDKFLSSKVEKPSTTRETAIKGALLAKVNDWAIGTEDFSERLEALKTLYPQAENLDTDTKKKILQELINVEILSQEARRRGLNKNKDVKDAVKDFERSLLVQKLSENIAKEITITDIETENFYKTNQLVFREPEERKIREILVGNESQAKNILIRLLQGEDFSSLAREVSKAKSRNKGGDLGYLAVKQDEKFQKFWEVAFTTDKGKSSTYFKGPDGYYLLKVEGIKGGKVKQLNDVKSDIKDYLRTEKIGKRIEDVVYDAKQKFKITINEYLID